MHMGTVCVIGATRVSYTASLMHSGLEPGHKKKKMPKGIMDGYTFPWQA